METIRDENMKRPRGRGRRNNNTNNPNKHFESNGPDVRIRGSAQQILTKYMQYARDAQTSGDRVNAENYFQHAEHYLRILAKLKPREKPKEVQESLATDDAGKDEAGSDPLKVIDDVEAGEGDAVKADAPAENGKKPRRRRTYKKRETGAAEKSAASAEPVEDGVMKTLSRGTRKRAAVKAEPADDGKTQIEAAE